MGAFSVEFSIGDAGRRQWRQLSAVVAASQSISFVPGSVLRDLGILPVMARSFQLSDGTERTIRLGYTWLRLNDREAMTHFAFGDDHTCPTLGRIAVNSSLLEIDSANERLVPMTIFPL